MGRRSKGRRDHGTGTVSKWTRNGIHIGWKGYVELPRGEDGKRKTTPPIYVRDTSAEARKALGKQVAALAEQHRGGVKVEISARDTFQTYLETWLQNVASLSVEPITLESYESKLRCHVYKKLGKFALSALTATHLTSLYSDLLKQGKKKRTVQYVHAVIHRALADAVAHRILAYNVASTVKAPKPDKKEARFIDPEKIPALCDALIDDWLYSLFYLALATGMRRGELCALRWDDIDWDRNKVRVDESCQELSTAKGGLRYSKCKTDRSRRTILVPEETMDVLRTHRKTQAEHRLLLGPNWKGQDFVFTSPSGEPLRPSSVSHHWKLVREKVGVPDVEEVVLHGLRHTHACMLLLAGIQPKVCADRLGHATAAFTMDTYKHVTQSMEDEVAEKVKAIMPGRIRAVK